MSTNQPAFESQGPFIQPRPTVGGVLDNADVISIYTRRQAIEDGVLVDLMQGELQELVRECGFVFPVAVTAEVFADCIELTDAAKRSCNDVKGRCWDVLWMLKHAVKRSRPGEESLRFEIRCVVNSIRPSRIQLKAVVGPGDEGEPVITVMYPNQD